MPVPSFSSVLTTDTPNAGRVKWNSGISDIISNGVFLTPGSAQSGSIWISGSITAGSVVLPAQAAHSFFAGPTTGTAAPTFRAIDASDLPATSLIGTIADTQVAFGDSSSHITGSSNFTYTGGQLSLTYNGAQDGATLTVFQTGTQAEATAIHAEAAGEAKGLFGSSVAGYGIFGISTTGVGVYGSSIVSGSTVQSISLTASRLLASDGSKILSSVVNLSSWIAGTSNRVNVSDDGDGSLTLSGPQDIHSGASPTFAGLTLTSIATFASSLITLSQDISAASGKSIYNTFTSGQFGLGYRLDHNSSISGQSFLEIDNLVVRGTMRVNVFEKGVIKAVSGGIYLSSASSTIMFDHPLTTIGNYDSFIVKDNTFAENDTLQYKDLTITGGLIVVSAFFRVWTQGELDSYWGYPAVTQFDPDSGGYRVYGELVTGSGTLRAGGTIVQVANSTNTTRQAGLFLTANDGSANVPYIDVYNGRTSYVTIAPKVRFGNLAGITDASFGTLTGYGLYAQNVYLTGNAQIAGTLTAGYNGLTGATFYAGKIGTNILTKPSEAFSTWNDPGSSGITVTDNNAVSPDGKTTASRWVRSGGTNFYRYNLTTTATAGKTFTFSIWLKGAAGGEQFQLVMARWTDFGWTVFDIKTLTTSWQRYSVTGTDDNGAPSNAVYVGLQQNSDSSTVYLWGAHFEVASQATAYQPVDGSATYAGTEQFGMWSIAGGFGGTLQNPTVQLGSYGMKVTSGGVATALAASSIMIGKITGTANSAIKIANTGTSGTSGLFGYTGGGAESFALRLDGSASIAGWAFTSTLLSKTVLAGDWARLMEFDSSNLRISIKLYDTSVNDNGGMASMGIDPKTGTDIGFWAGTVNIAGAPTTDWFYFRQPLSAPASPTAFIAGWSFDATKIYKSNAVLSSTGYVSFGSTPPSAYGSNVGAWLGDASGTAKLSLYASSTNYLQWDGASLTGVGGTIGTGPTGVSRIQLRGSISALEFVIASAGTDVDTATFKPIDTGGGVIGVHLEGTSALPVLLIAGTFPLASDTETYSLLSGNVIAAFDRESGVNHNVKLLGWESGVSSPSLQIDNTRVVRNRQTGWGAPTATLSRTALTNSSTTTDVLQHLAALVTDLTSHGLIGA